ncbi:hypothetical protein TRAPUB_7916 [Trametes pubescens]|uniref:YCII-related domain-containing protein n=1 Tax=Trametes pubescens TaxID=154538 RepID=A0A1M2V256_TRAPU|nr:hypothetical protein TRAPUB_7916 [Trametes pubescens]
MSASAPTLNYYHVYAQDLPDAQRAKHTEAHMAQNTPLIQSGVIKFGGGLLRPESNSSDLDARQSIVGSFIIVQAESIEAVWEILHKEIFYVSGEVWDREKVFVAPVYVPFKEARFE